MAVTHTLTLKHTFAATTERIWHALTDSAAILAWSEHKGIVEPYVEGYVEFFDGWARGEVLSWKPPTELAFTWRPDQWELKWEDSEVLFALKAVPEGTELTLLHDNLPTKEEVETNREGWPKYFFEPIAAYLQG